MSRAFERNMLCYFVAGGFALAVVLSGGWLQAAPPSNQSRSLPPGNSPPTISAEDLILEALCAEIDGRAADRARLLAAARAQSPDLPAVRWSSGEVRHNNAWVAAEQMPSVLANDVRWANYQHERENLPDTLEANLRLAKFCVKRGLEPQRIAHFTRALDFDPNHAEARAALGFQQTETGWVQIDELRRQRARAEAAAKNWKIWEPRVLVIAKGISADSQLRRLNALDKLAAIDDVAAIGALEAILSPECEEGALAVVRKLAGWTDLDATESLARHAVLSPWENVRTAAAKALSPRAEDDYIPLLIAGIYSPAIGQTQTFIARNGNLVHRQVFVREGQAERQVVGLETAYRRIPAAGGNGNDTLSRAAGDLRLTNAQRLQELERQNALTLELNQRIVAALSEATGEKIPAEAAQVWQWWNDRNEQFLAGSKPVSAQLRSRQINVFDQVPTQTPAPTTPVSSSPGTPLQGFMCECLVAGTRVWTASGPRSIEEIRVGDMILSQHPATGELAFQPVLRTTTRPPEKLLRIRAGQETITATGGHPFWVAGEGWVKARALRGGFELHGADGSVPILSVQPGETAETYNMVVAEFHTYFVGYGKVLSHDNSIRRPTVVPVPGAISK